MNAWAGRVCAIPCPILLVLHFVLVRVHGISSLPWGSPCEIEIQDRAEARVPYTSHLLRLGVWSLALSAVLLVLTALLPATP